MAPEAKAATGASGRVMSAAQGAAIAAYNAWYDVSAAGRIDAAWSVTQPAMIMLGAKLMISEIEVQMACIASLFTNDEEFDTSVAAVIDADWSRYAMAFGPVDEQAKGRLWAGEMSPTTCVWSTSASPPTVVF